jgi:iron complex transport system permease protein
VTTVAPPRRERRWVLPALGIALVGAMLLAASVGAVTIPPSEIAAAAARKLGLGSEEVRGTADAVLWGIRVPRIVLGAIVGLGLGAAGAVYQGVFRNPLADPQLLGIAPGAALGAAIGAAAGGVYATLAGGTVGGVMAAFGVRRIGSRFAEADPTRMVLVGVAVGAVLSAWVGFVVFASDRARVPPVEFWLLGSLTGATWRAVAVCALVLAAGVAVLMLSWRKLDLLALGHREAQHLGIDVEALTTRVMVATGALVGVSVGAVGVVAFVGLVAPHVVRPLTGPSNRRLVPAAAVTGALFVVLADVAARTLFAPIEIPVGLLTAAVGGPLFIWLIVSRER